MIRNPAELQYKQQMISDLQSELARRREKYGGKPEEIAFTGSYQKLLDQLEKEVQAYTEQRPPIERHLMPAELPDLRDRVVANAKIVFSRREEIDTVLQYLHDSIVSSNIKTLIYINIYRINNEGTTPSVSVEIGLSGKQTETHFDIERISEFLSRTDLVFAMTLDNSRQHKRS